MSLGPAHTTQPNAPASRVERPPWALHVVHPSGLNEAPIPLHGVGILGRGRTDLGCLDHHTVSRTHAEIRPAPSGYLLRDLGSTNGTFINGEPLESASLLLPQMVVRLGDVFAVVDDDVSAPFLELPEVPGTTSALLALRERLGLAAREQGPVLITGETGTGKERLAAAVHRLSGRSGPYVTFNCAELSPQLVESQLFGHERGAFTGATSSQPGLFAAAHQGTLFLDEVGELPLELQSKLLRVLETGEVRRLGSVRSMTVQVRVVAATNRPMLQAVNQGVMRRDLYARLAGWELELPPLRRRRQDILRWITYLAQLWNDERGTSAELVFSPRAVARILQCRWPENLRGLRRLVHRLMPLAARSPEPVGESILFEALPELFECSLDEAGALFDSSLRRADSPLTRTNRAEARSSITQPPAGDPAPRDEVAAARPSREELLDVYVRLERSVRATAKHFGKDRRQIYRWLTSYGIER